MLLYIEPNMASHLVYLVNASFKIFVIVDGEMLAYMAASLSTIVQFQVPPTSLLVI